MIPDGCCDMDSLSLDAIGRQEVDSEQLWEPRADKEEEWNAATFSSATLNQHEETAAQTRDNGG